MSNQYEDFLIKQGLYSRAPITESTEQDWLELLKGEVKISCYCPECKEKRVFILEPPKVNHLDQSGGFMTLSRYLISRKQRYNVMYTSRPDMTNEETRWFWRQDCDAAISRIIELSFHCAMDDQHCLDFVLQTGDDYVEKIGQKPSLADLSFNDINKYKKVTGDQTIKELKRAIGLNAQGIGIGSYVYLRRIFERIIDQAKTQSISRGDFCEDDFANKRIDEQIRLLKNYLPDVLVNNGLFYKIVSKGIHELSEEDCIKFFPVLKDAIVLIWNEWQREQEEQNAIDSLNASLNKISSEL